MKILVIGGGGREHALAWKLSQSPRTTKVYVAPGNGGTALSPRYENLPITDVVALREYVRSLDTAPAVVTRIRSDLNPTMCVNIKGALNTSGTTAVQWPCGNANNEKFTITTLTGGYVQFVAEHSGLCLAQNGTATTNAPVVQLACSAGNTTQWNVIGSTIRNRASGSCLDIPNSATAQDTALITWTCNGGNNQNWTQMP